MASDRIREPKERPRPVVDYGRGSRFLLFKIPHHRGFRLDLPPLFTPLVESRILKSRKNTEMEKKSVFDKLHEALTRGQGVSLTFAEVELLFEYLDDALAKAETEYEIWRERVEDSQRSFQRESHGSDSEP